MTVARGIASETTRWRGLRVGLLGGSFNPAHEGHRHIAETALKALDLHAVWLMVSPGNPLKDPLSMASFNDRLKSAKQQAGHPMVFASDIEQKLGTCRTADTLDALQTAMPETNFIWLMGADNMQQFDRWFAWQKIVDLLPIAIFDRPTYSIAALTSRFARTYASRRTHPGKIWRKATPAWCFVTLPRHHASATAVRARQALPDG